jgi:hypothetical protein
MGRPNNGSKTHRRDAVLEANDRFALASARKLNGAREANMKAA